MNERFYRLKGGWEVVEILPMLPQPAFGAFFYFMILRLVIEDDDENVLDVSSVLNNNIFISIDSGLGESFIELDYDHTKELIKFLNKQLKNFANE